MTKQLLSVIADLELLRAQALVNHDTVLAFQLNEALYTLHWTYKYLIEYE